MRSPTAAPPPPAPLAPRAVAPAAPALPTTVPRLAQMSPIVRRGVAQVTAPSMPSRAPVSQNEGVPFGSSLTESQVFVGEKISFGFSRCRHQPLLRLIAEVGKVRYHCRWRCGGQGKVTARMTDVPGSSLGRDPQDQPVERRIAAATLFVWPPWRTSPRNGRSASKAQVTEVQAEPTVTRIVQANYALVKDLRPNLEKLLSKRGTIITDTRTNTMIITTPRPVSTRPVLGFIEKLDRAAPQVMIEARIVERHAVLPRQLGISTRSGLFPHYQLDVSECIDVRGGLPAATNTGGLAPPQPPADFPVGPAGPAWR